MNDSPGPRVRQITTLKVWQVIGVLLLMASATGASASVNVGTPFPGQSFQDLANAADPGQAPLLGLDLFLSSGTNFGFGAMAADPPGTLARITHDGLAPDFGLDPNDFGILDLKAEITRNLGGPAYALSARFKLAHQDNGPGPGLALGAGEYARYEIFDPSRAPGESIGLRYTLAPSGNVILPLTRFDVFSINIQHLVTPAGGGAPYAVGTGTWQGGAGSAFTLGLLDEPGIVTSADDLGAFIDRGISGSTAWDVLIPNGTQFDQMTQAFINLSGPGGGTGDVVMFNLYDTVNLSFAPAPGFEAAQVSLIGAIPLPGALLLGFSALSLLFAGAHPRHFRRAARA